MSGLSRDGIISLNKPVGITSAKAVYRVRSITRVRKSGHAGSLDPAARGVLIVCQGRATKLVERVMALPKRYRATGRLDVTSESFDSDRPLQPVEVTEIPTCEQVTRALSSFEGEIEQVPPRVSAVKLSGVPAYKTLGKADAPPLRARKARIDWIRLRAYDWPCVDFEMACGRGTYVRAIIRDLGIRLGTGGCLTSLVRSAVGPFEIDRARTFEQLAERADGGAGLIPLETARAMIESFGETWPAS